MKSSIRLNSTSIVALMAFTGMVVCSQAYERAPGAFDQGGQQSPSIRPAPRVARSVDISASGFTPAHMAAGRGDMDLINALDNEGIDWNKPHAQGLRLIHLAAGNAKAEAVRRLVQLGAKPWEIDGAGRDALAQAQYHAKPDNIAYLESIHPSRVTDANRGQFQKELVESAFIGDTGRVYELLAMGLSPNIPVENITNGEANGQGVIHVAASQGHIPVIKAAMSAKGADINAICLSKNTAVYYAMKGKQDLTLRYLHQIGADFNKAGRLGSPLLFAATWMQTDPNYRAIYDLLISLGAREDEQVKRMVTPVEGEAQPTQP